MLKLYPPQQGEVYQTQTTQLTGRDFQIQWLYNERCDSWSISILAVGETGQDPTPVLMGAKVFIGFDLLRRCQHPLRPLGSLYCYANDGGRAAPRFNELGARCNVVYFEPGESVTP